MTRFSLTFSLALVAVIGVLLAPQQVSAQSRANDSVQVLAAIQQPVPQVSVSGIGSVRLGAVTFARLAENICIYTLGPDDSEQVSVFSERTNTTTIVTDGGTVSGCAFRPGETRTAGEFGVSCGSGLTLGFSMNASGSGVVLNPLSFVRVRTSDTDPGQLVKISSTVTCPAAGLLAVDVGVEMRLRQVSTQPNSQVGTLTLNAEIQ